MEIRKDGKVRYFEAQTKTTCPHCHKEQKKGEIVRAHDYKKIIECEHCGETYAMTLKFEITTVTAKIENGFNKE